MTLRNVCRFIRAGVRPQLASGVFSAAVVANIFFCRPRAHCEKPQRLQHRTDPFVHEEARSVLPLPPDRYASLEVLQSDGLLYRYLSLHIGSVGAVRSSRLTWSPETPCAGLGWFRLFDEDWGELWAVHQTVGAPAAGVGPPQLYHSIVLLAPGLDGPARLHAFCKKVLALYREEPEPGKITVYRFDLRAKSWQRLAVRAGRPWASVALPARQRQLLDDDLTWFSSPATEARFTSLGVPYKRVYLFSGPPGVGKTSTATAIATSTQRLLCLLPFDEQFTDDVLLFALQRTPVKPLVVIEDAELWIKRPGGAVGLMNALDGVATQSGAVFVLTSNNPEVLQATHQGAFVRPGRVDLHISFPLADAAVIQALFTRFFPDAPQEAVDSLSTAPEGVSPALVQHQLLSCDRDSVDATRCAQRLSDALRSDA